MIQAREDQLREIFGAVLERPAGERDALLETLCGDDLHLRAEIKALLAADSMHDGLLGDVERGRLAGLIAPADEEDGPLPERLGAYRVLGRLGVGATGVVYEVEQESPKRRVALKVLRDGGVHRDAARRFAHEADVLARVEHPAIARVYDCGTLDGGRGPEPFYTMELVRGSRLDEHVRAKRPHRRERLELFIDIGEGVHAAHSVGVVHRDLKPANILIDHQGRPKIIDFGVAHLGTGAAREATLATMDGVLLGTLAYMSPEQVEGRSASADARSDVYALGVILYELLAGKTPHDLSGTTLPEAIRRVREVEPRRLGAADAACRGDLDTIVSKALERDPARRYASASALAADVRRFLHDEPIAARPASTWYQLAKFSKRNRGLVIGVAGVMLILLGSTAAIAVFAVREAGARRAADENAQRAEDEASIARAVNQFVNEDLLGAADPSVSQGRDRTVREVLAIAEQKVGGRFADQPLTEAAVRMTLGATLSNLGDYVGSEGQFARALALRRTSLGDNASPVFEAEEHLARSLWHQSRTEESVAMRRASIARARVALGESHPVTIDLMNGLGDSLRSVGQFEEAISLLEAVVRVRKGSPGEDHKDTLTSMNNLGLAYHHAGRHEDAVGIIRRVGDRGEALWGPKDPYVLTWRANLGVALWRLGKFDEAETALTPVIEHRTEVLGADHADTLYGRNNRARVYERQGRLVEAEREFRAVLERRIATLGERHRDTLASRLGLGTSLLGLGNCVEAAEVLQRACVEVDEILPNDAARRGEARVLYGRCLARLGRPKDAEQYLTQGLELLARAPGAPPWLAREATPALDEVRAMLATDQPRP